MRSPLSQVTHLTYIAVVGVLLTIGFIGYLCAQSVTSPGFISSERTIQRLPPVELSLERLPLVEIAPTNPPYGSQWSGEASAESAESLPTPEGESVEGTGSDVPLAPLGFPVLNEDLAWINEVRPDSMLVRTTRYLSQYVGKWEGSVQLGLDGTSGSSETFNSAFGINGKRKFELATFKFDVDYKRNTSDGVITADRLFFTCRYENPYGDGKRWHFFVQDEVTYDEFQPWDLQVAVSSGVGYNFWQNETAKLQALLGGGFSQDIGGPDDAYVPEMHLGLNGERQINKRQKLIASCDYYPDVTDFNSSRVISKASWEVLLDEEVNLSMKFNITDRLYTPNPGGKPNDLDYSILLMWKF